MSAKKRGFVWLSVLFLVVGIVSARADFFNHPWVGDVSPLLVTNTSFEPPAWLNDCVVEVAGDTATTTTNCLPTLTIDSKSDHFVFDLERQMQLQQVNDEVNQSLAGFELKNAIERAVSKRNRLIELGWPAIIVTYAISDVPDEAGEINDSIVALIVLNARAWVLDHDVLPWQYSANRLYAIQISTGEWRAVVDDRDDPGYNEVEWYCAIADCEIVNK